MSKNYSVYCNFGIFLAENYIVVCVHENLQGKVHTVVVDEFMLVC